MRALLAWLVLSVACSTPGPRPAPERPLAPDNDSLLSCWTKNRKAVFVLRTGQSYRCVLQVRNPHDQAIAVESVAFLDNPAQRKVELSETPVGRFSRTSDERYILHGEVAQVAQMALWRVLVPPGQSRRVAFEYLLLNQRERLEVRYVLVPPSVAVYVGRAERFERAAPERLARLAEGDRLLIPEADAQPRRAVTYAVTAANGLRIPMQVAEEAARRLMADTSTTGQVAVDTHESSFELRLLPSSGDYLVEPHDKTVPCFRLRTADQLTRGPDLPHDGEVVQEILEKAPQVWVKVGDEQEGIGPERRPPHRTFLGRWGVFYGDGRYRRGEFIDVAPADWGALLDYLVHNDLRLIKVYYFYDRYYFRIAPSS